MDDISYKKSLSYSDKNLVSQFGKFILHHRIKQNKSQDEVAEAAGISRSTLSLMERNGQTTLNTFVRILRVLDLLYVMDTFEVIEEISPLAYAKMKKKSRKKASPKNNNNNMVSESDDLSW
jgi:transcriptional regulator with XRE-family HTH domain